MVCLLYIVLIASLLSIYFLLLYEEKLIIFFGILVISCIMYFFFQTQLIIFSVISGIPELYIVYYNRNTTRKYFSILWTLCTWTYTYYIKRKKQESRLNFLMECVEQIFEEYAIQQTETSKVSRPITSSVAKPIRFIGKNFPNFIPAVSSKVNAFQRFAVCSRNGIRKEPRHVKCHLVRYSVSKNTTLKRPTEFLIISLQFWNFMQ